MVSRRQRLEAYLYSRRNIVGSALAVGGLGLVVTGLVSGPLGLGVVAALYAIGALVVPAEQGLAIQLDAAQDASKIRSGLDDLVRGIQGRVAPDILAKVVSIRNSILATLPSGSAVDVGDPNVYLIRQTALTYLPQALNSYLAIPRQFAERRAVADGRTPHDVLLGQLDLMDRKLQEVADDIARHDSDQLLANGRFIAERFGSSSLQIGDPVSVGATATVPDVTAAPVKEPVAAEERERVH